ncbi:FAD-dependent monooxygenase [Candidatus Poriferisodalis sp.]|uniref:FAD-dependent monooxygenase n=1 Tax=Candidatus Poriferisodalis sp. TaxID=3101277 RepID=UPI003D0DA255
MPDATVLVVGAGPAGLAMAILLARMGLDTIVVERRSGVNPHPRARSVNVRTAELMRQWGLLDEIDAVSRPRRRSAPRQLRDRATPHSGLQRAALFRERPQRRTDPGGVRIR